MKKSLSVFLLLLFTVVAGFGDEPEGDTIPEAEFLPLKQEYRQAASARNKSAKRRAYKKVVRKGNSLLEKYPLTTDRFQVLSVIFDSQKRLLLINNNKENRDDVFATAKEIVKAPMEFSQIRLQPEMLLLKAKISKNDMSNAEKALEVKAMAETYLDSPAEAKCLMYLIMIAKDLNDQGLFNELKLNLASRFSQDAEASMFLRERFGVIKRDLRFTGVFRSLKGKTLSFPVDLVGHNYMACFWSTTTPDLKKRFSQIKDYQRKSENRFEVFSFNVDELDDAGSSILAENSLDWTAMHLPKGTSHPSFLKFGNSKSSYVLLPCNAQGFSLGKSNNRHTMHDSDVDVDAILNSADYLSLLKALSSGHFLISEVPSFHGAASKGITSSEPVELKELFVPFQKRYRQSNLEALQSYESIVQTCDQIIKENPKAANLWKHRNAKIIALLGIWKEGLSPESLVAAGKEADTVIASTDLPLSAKVIAHFCRAKQKLRTSENSAKSVVEGFLNECGGPAAPPSALGAAAILAVDGGQETRDLYLKYRYAILSKLSGEPVLQPVSSYLLAESQEDSLFQANEKKYYFGSTSIYTNKRSKEVEHQFVRRRFDLDFTSLSGEALSIPDAQSYHYHLCLFLDLPKSEEQEAAQLRMFEGVKGLAKQSRRKEIKIVLCYPSQSKENVSAFLKKNQLDYQAAIFPSGPLDPMLTKLGIFSYESGINTVLFSPDGHLLENYSRMYHVPVYPRKGANTKEAWFNCMSPEHVTNALKSSITRYDNEIGLKAYQEKNWPLAKRHLGLTFNDSEKVLGRNRAKLKEIFKIISDYQGLLELLNHSIATHKKPQYGIYRFPWKKHQERAEIYEKLGEVEKAAADRKYAAELKIKDDAVMAKQPKKR